MIMRQDNFPIAVTNNHQKHQISVPDPMTRAQRVDASQQNTSTILYTGQSIGCDAIVAVVSRDMSGAILNEAQRLSHFPASSLVGLSWHNDIAVGRVEKQNHDVLWTRFDQDVLISGSQSQPTVFWSLHSGRGGMMYFTLNAAKALFNIDVTLIQDKIVCARELLDPSWFAMFDQLVASKDDESMLKIIKHHISSRWDNMHCAANAIQSLQYAGRKWVDKLALQAKLWHDSRSIRQVQRSIKAMSGRSLREWQLLVSTEKVFFDVTQDDPNALQRLDWATLALEAGFSDQAHLSRTVKRITGFPPAEFARRYIEDESFWIYRLWH